MFCCWFWCGRGPVRLYSLSDLELISIVYMKKKKKIEKVRKKKIKRKKIYWVYCYMSESLCSAENISRWVRRQKLKIYE